MRRFALQLVVLGGIGVTLGVLIQAFTIAAYARGAGDSARDLHEAIGGLVMLLEIVLAVGAFLAWRANRRTVVAATVYLVVAVLQLRLIGDTDAPGGWVNGLHGMLALVVFAMSAMLTHRALREIRG